MADERRLIPVIDHPNLMKDVSTGAVVNINKEEMEKARERKAARRKNKEKIKDLENELVELRKTVQELIGKLDGKSS